MNELKQAYEAGARWATGDDESIITIDGFKEWYSTRPGYESYVTFEKFLYENCHIEYDKVTGEEVVNSSMSAVMSAFEDWHKKYRSEPMAYINNKLSTFKQMIEEKRDQYEAQNAKHFNKHGQVDTKLSIGISILSHLLTELLKEIT